MAYGIIGIIAVNYKNPQYQRSSARSANIAGHVQSAGLNDNVLTTKDSKYHEEICVLTILLRCYAFVKPDGPMWQADTFNPFWCTAFKPQSYNRSFYEITNQGTSCVIVSPLLITTPSPIVTSYPMVTSAPIWTSFPIVTPLPIVTF